jgi:hypothetical protein
MIEQGGRDMKYSLADMGIYIVVHAKGRDPRELGCAVARKLHLHSIDTESLLTMIYAAKHFGIDDDIKEEVERDISKSPVYAQLNELLR